MAYAILDRVAVVAYMRRLIIDQYMVESQASSSGFLF
jgi:hypothetical protein